MADEGTTRGAPLFLGFAPVVGVLLIWGQISDLSQEKRPVTWMWVGGAALIGALGAWLLDRRIRGGDDRSHAGTWSLSLFGVGFAVYSILSHGFPQALPILIGGISAFLGATFVLQKLISSS